MAVITDELVRDEVRTWLGDNWDPEITLAEWWDRLCESGWAAPTWPEQWFGKGLPRELASVVNEELRAAGAIGPPSGLGVLLAGPTILQHGDDEQRERYLRPILNGTAGVVSAVQRARRRVRPRQPPVPRRARRRRMDRERTEGVDVGSADRRPRHARRPHRS